jgi:hypothetical protein
LQNRPIGKMLSGVKPQMRQAICTTDCQIFVRRANLLGANLVAGEARAVSTIQVEERLPNQKSNVGTRSPNATPCGNGCCDASWPGFPKTAPAMDLGEKVLKEFTRDTYSRKTGGGKVSKPPHRQWGKEFMFAFKGHLFTNPEYDPP